MTWERIKLHTTYGDAKIPSGKTGSRRGVLSMRTVKLMTEAKELVDSSNLNSKLFNF